MECPQVNKALLEHLEETFPDKCPNKTATLDEVRIQSGQVDVVRYLRRKYDHQINNQVTT